MGTPPAQPTETRFSVAFDNGSASDLVVAVVGDIDIVSGPEFRECLEAAIEQCDRVIVDLEGVGFMDSTGVNVLVRAMQHAGRLDTEFAVRAASAQIRRLFTLTGVDETLRIG
jgi:anti-anti-sigma factor